MKTCINGCGKQAGFSQMKTDILDAQLKHVLAPVPIEMIFACGIIESNGNMFFDGTEDQYKANLAVLKARGQLTTLEALDLVRITGGKNNGKIAKFRYELSWGIEVGHVIGRKQGVEPWRDVLHLSIGYFQKGMVWHLAGKPAAEWEGAYQKFLRDPTDQVKVCANDLHGLMQSSKGDMRLAFSRYNAGASQDSITNYGNRAYDLYKNLSTSPLRR